MAAVKMWGNSAALRIPAAVLEQACLSVDEPVTLRAEKGRIVVESIMPNYDIDALVAAINPGNLPPYAGHMQAEGAEAVEW